MSFDDLFDYLIPIIVAAQILGSLFKKLRQKGAPADEAPGLEPATHGDWVGEMRQRIDRAQRDGAALDEAIADLGRTTQSGDLVDLHAVIRHPTRFELTEALQALDQYASLAGGSGEPDLAALIAEAPGLAIALQTVETTRIRAQILQTIAEARLGTRRAYLGDADALARALLDPIQQFASAHGVGFPEERPICAPAGEFGESVILGLFDRHPLIFVPHDFREELMRWASVAHEIGHVLWRDVPGLADEAARVGGVLSDRARLPRLDGRDVHFEPASVVGPWLEELFCDLVTVMLLGPAGLRSAAAVFADPDDPDEVAWCRTHDGQTLTEHPPKDLRIRLGAWTLDRMGFDREAKALLAEWRAVHGEQAAAIVPTTFVRAVGVPMEVLEQHTRQALARLLDHGWDSLAGRTLESIHGLGMGPGLWARVDRRTQAMLDGEPFNDDPRVVVAAAIEAVAIAPGRQLEIGAHARVAIQGLGEAKVEDQHYARSAGPRTPESTRLRDAVVLAEILRRRGGAA